MGKVKRLELWWQLYVTRLPVRDLENFKPMEFLFDWLYQRDDMLFLEHATFTRFIGGFPIARQSWHFLQAMLDGRKWKNAVIGPHFDYKLWVFKHSLNCWGGSCNGASTDFPLREELFAILSLHLTAWQNWHISSVGGSLLRWTCY